MSEATAAPHQAHGLNVLYVRQGHCVFAHEGPMVYQVWLAPAEVPDALELRKVADLMYSKYPEAISTIHLLRHGTGLPGSEARTHMSSVLKAYGDWFGQVVIVMEGGGFWAGAVRSMLTGIRMAAGGRGHLRLAGSMKEVAEFMPAVHRQRTGARLTGAQIMASMEQLVQRGS